MEMTTLRRMPYGWIRVSTFGALALAVTALLAACTNGPVPAAQVTTTEVTFPLDAEGDDDDENEEETVSLRVTTVSGDVRIARAS